MITITHNYTSINKPNMTASFIIRPERVLKVWDIDPGVIGVTFIDYYEYRIELAKSNKTLEARDILESILKNVSATIEGDVRPN